MTVRTEKKKKPCGTLSDLLCPDKTSVHFSVLLKAFLSELFWPSQYFAGKYKTDTK